ALLDRGSSVVWFPEGRRSPTGELTPFRPGVGVLLKGSQCLVVPTRISGTYEAWPPQRARPRFGGTLRIDFGEPISVDALVAEGRGDTDELKIVDALERRVAALGADAARERPATSRPLSAPDAGGDGTKSAQPSSESSSSAEPRRESR